MSSFLGILKKVPPHLVLDVKLCFESFSQAGDLWMVKVLLDAGAQPNFQDDSGYTPVHVAASNGLAGILRLLLSSGGDANALNTNLNSTPLHLACQGSAPSLDCVIELLHHGGKANVLNERKSSLVDGLSGGQH